MDTYLSEKYSKAKELSEFPDNPESNPFQSKYEARKLLQDIRDDIHQWMENDETISLLWKEAAVEYHLGVNYIYTEEISAGQEKLDKVLALCTDEMLMMPQVVGIYIASCNELGLVWSTREEGIKIAFDHLAKAENLYHLYKKCTDIAPHTIHDHFTNVESSEVERRKSFENLHTYTLYYLAQVYKSLDQPDKSAAYCMKTLRRQLEFQTYKPAEWALNCACLSQYFITCNMYAKGKHCLSCANFVMNEVHEDDEEVKSKYNENKADIARCWVKYCLCLLEASKERMENNGQSHEITNDEIEKSYERFSLEVTSVEESVRDALCTNYEEAKQVFLLGKQYASKALRHFVLDGFVTDYVEINQDISRLYQYIAFFESEIELKCRMYKRRIDLITPILNELNPQFYLAICRQLQFELGEIYSDMMDMKLLRYNRSEENQTIHARKKINSLCNSSIKYFFEFIKTLKTSNKKFPDRLEGDVERPGLIAHFYIARLYSKLIPNTAQEKLDNLKLSLQYYSFVPTYTERNQEASSCVVAELQICRDMMEVLPKTLDKLITQISL